MSIRISNEFLEALAVAAGFNVLEYKGTKYVQETETLQPLEKLVKMLLDLQSISNGLEVLGALIDRRIDRNPDGDDRH